MATAPGSEKILHILQPYASNWSGTLQRGDVVIPRAELQKLVEEIAALLGGPDSGAPEADELEVFQVLQEASRAASLQSQAARLRKVFRILKRQP